MNKEPELKSWEELKEDWQDFLNGCTRKQKRALSYFLFKTEDSSKGRDQYEEICNQIREPGRLTTKSELKLLRSFKIDVVGEMQPLTYKDLNGNDHTRFIYADPYLAGHRRLFAELGPARAKHPLRCAQKLVRKRKWLKFKGDYKKWIGSSQWWEKVYDLVAFRVVYNFLGDIKHARENLRLVLEAVGYHLAEKEYIWNIDEARKRGARSVHIILTTPSPAKRVIEVQLMTMLQFAWDQSEHVIEYEQKRLREEAAEAPNSREKRPGDTNTMLFRSLSDLLYIADETVDRIYQAQKTGKEHYVGDHRS